MTSLRPYLIQALIDWIIDNDCTPYAVVDCAVEGAKTLQEYATDGKLVLNLSAAATRNLLVDERSMSVDCRFQGRAVHVEAPVGAVIAVYARENGLGMAFEAETLSASSPDKPRAAAARGKKAPVLKLIK